MIVSRYISPQNKRIIRGIIARIKKPQRRIISKYPIEILSGDNSFFGYYDVDPFALNSSIVFIQVVGSTADIFCYDLQSKTKKYITSTNAWNWQQGCRLRVSRDRESIFYNNYINEKFISIKKSLTTGRETVFNTPFYDIDPFEKLAVSLDFERLGKLRPGYGYVVNDDLLLSNDCGDITIFDLQENKIIEKYHVSHFITHKEMKNSFFYINHLSFSPNGKNIMFFLIEKPQQGFHIAHMYILNLDKKEIYPLEVDLCVSHYAWKDNENILVTAYDHNRKCAYYIYDITTHKKIRIDCSVLNEDGHPTWISDKEIITDTYPDKYGYEHIYKVNLENGRYERLCSVYHSYKVSGEQRCDLHPRVSSARKLICFDANTRGYKQLLLMREVKL